MEWSFDIEASCPNVSEEELSELRRALLQIDRAGTRKKGQRKLERIAAQNHISLSPLALAGLASSFYWSGDLVKTVQWCQQAVQQFPMSPVSLWCATLLVTVFRTLGMKRERFDAEGDRFRLMKRIALQGRNTKDRIVALNELRIELENRELFADAERCLTELKALVRVSPDEKRLQPIKTTLA